MVRTPLSKGRPRQVIPAGNKGRDNKANPARFPIDFQDAAHLSGLSLLTVSYSGGDNAAAIRLSRSPDRRRIVREVSST